jgi:hypothetical protein
LTQVPSNLKAFICAEICRYADNIMIWGKDVKEVGDTYAKANPQV